MDSFGGFYNELATLRPLLIENLAKLTLRKSSLAFLNLFSDDKAGLNIISGFYADR